MITRAGKYILFAVFLSFGFAANAQRMRVIMRQPGYYTPNQQRPGENVLKVRKLKEEFISKQLLLSPEQTNRFLVVYRHFEQDLGAVRVLKKINNSEQTPDGQDQIEKNLDYDRQMLEIRARYNQEFLKIMPPEKVSIIYKCEDIFNKEILRNIKERNAGAALPAGN